jgi:hypothetical protein
MNPQSPILDQPQVIEWAEDAPNFTQRLANGDILFEVDANTDLCDLHWPWAGEQYAKRIALRVSAPREEDLIPMVTRLYPGHQELILGTEGVILTKRVAAPRQSEYDRSVIWLLDCQAEGDRLLRLDVTIDWGEPLTQRMVDGLLVAQRNPGPQRGIYSQSNAELTCVFGNPQARPDEVDLISPQEAHLVYHVLVNGMVEVPLILTFSDVGEQMAWNGFLALRDADRAFELSTKSWETLLKTGRLWTPDAALNQAVQLGKLTAARHLQRVRTGFAATTGDTVHTAALVTCTDSYDIILSRNLLAHLRRVAEATLGRLPVTLPSHPKTAAIDPGGALAATNGAYLAALIQHLQHHFDWSLLDEHYQAVGLCAAQLQRVAQEQRREPRPELRQALRAAAQLAQWQGDQANAAEWQTHAADPAEPATLPAVPPIQHQAVKPRCFADPWTGITWAGAVLWQGCGLCWQADALWVTPTWPQAWPWWALIDLPYVGDRKLTLLWDGQTLHTTQPIQSALPMQQWDSIRARRTDELEFDLHFALQSEQDGLVTHNTVHPTFFRNDAPDG